MSPAPSGTIPPHQDNSGGVWVRRRIEGVACLITALSAAQGLESLSTQRGGNAIRDAMASQEPKDPDAGGAFVQISPAYLETQQAHVFQQAEHDFAVRFFRPHESQGEFIALVILDDCERGIGVKIDRAGLGGPAADLFTWRYNRKLDSGENASDLMPKFCNELDQACC
jgi:hypothetical protein